MVETHIAIDYTPAYEQGAGIGRYVRELVAALAEQDRDTSYMLWVMGANATRLPPAPALNFQWKYSRLSPLWFARLWHRARLPIPVEQWVGAVQVFHATDFVLPPTRQSTRTLLTVHDLSFLRVPQAASPSLKRYLDAVVPRSAQRADHILADSQATKDDLVRFYHTEPAKISVLYSGVHPRFNPSPIVSAERETLRTRYNIEDWPFILAVGTVQPRKNYERLIHAFAQLPRQDVHLVIAGGKGWLDAPIYTIVAQLGLHQRVHFTGFLDDSLLPCLYKLARCLAFPSLYEGFGLPILEAMACGTPVVTAHVSSLPEVAGQAALLIDPYDVEALRDALSQLLDDDLLRIQLIAAGYAQANRFTWQRAATQLRDIYQRLVDGTT